MGKSRLDQKSDRAARELRDRAEERLRQQSADATALAPADAAQLLQELQVHQIELEMQNEELRNAQHELETARSKYFDLYDLAPVGYLTLSEAGLILEMNLATAKLFGVYRRNLNQQPLCHWIDPADQDIYYLHRRNLLATGEPQAYDVRMVKIDGTLFWAHVEINLVESRDGTRVSRLMLSDISARKQSEAGLVASAARFRSLVQDVGDGIAQVDAQERFVFINPMLEQILGRTSEQLLGQPFKQYIVPEHQSQFDEQFALQRADLHSSYKVDIARGDGTRRTLTLTVTPHFDAAGQFAGGLGVMRDVTDQDKAEQILRRYATLSENTRDIMLFVRADDGAIIEANHAACDAYGYARAELLTKKIFDLRSQDTATTVRAQMQRANQDGLLFEALHVRRDGTTFPVEVSSRGVQIGNDRLLLSVIRDITKRKQIEMDLHERMKELSCLYQIHQLLENDLSEDILYPQVIEYLMTAMQLPFSATVMLEYDAKRYTTERYVETLSQYLSSVITVNGAVRGRLCVYSTTALPFALPEEQKLLDNIAQALSNWIERKHTADTLRESEEQYRLLFENVGDGIGRAYISGEFISANPALEKILGVAPGGLIGRKMAEFVSPDHRATHTAQVERHRQGQKDSYEIQITRPNGALRTIVISATPWFDRAGNSAGVFGVFRDITERKRAEFVLAANERRNRALIENISDGIELVSVNGVVTYASPSASRVLGYGQHELLGPAARFIHPDDLAAAEANFATALASDQAVSQSYRVRHQDGSWRWLEGSVTNLLADPAIGALVVNFRDMTERKRAEQNLRLLAQAGRELGATLNLKEIYDAIPRIVRQAMPCDFLFVSNYNADDQLIRCGYGCGPQDVFDIADFPPLPLEAEGRGTQSRAIRSGESLILNDYATQVKTATTTYLVSEEGQVEQEAPTDEEFPRSALIVPLKLNGEVVGVIQTLSIRQNDYTERDLQLLESLALHVSSAMANARLFAQAQDQLAERTRAEEALRSSETKYRRMFDEAAFGIFHSTPAGRFLDVNPALAKMLGYASPQEVLDSITSIPDQVYAEKPRYAAVLESSFSNQIIRTENRYRRKDGSVWDANLTASQSKDENGQVIIEGFVEDITARKHAQAEQHLAHERFQRLFEQAPMMDIITRNEAGKPIIAECNQAFLRTLGYTAAQVVGRPLADIYSPESRTAMLEGGGYRRSLENTFYDEERALVAHDGQIIQTMLTAVPEIDAQGSVIGSRAMYVDITARKRAEEANAQLFVAEQTRRSELSALYDLARGLAATDSLDETSGLIARETVATLHVTFARIILFENNQFIVRAAYPIRLLDCDLQVPSAQSTSQKEFFQTVLAQSEPIVVLADQSALAPEDHQNLFLCVARSICLVPLHAGDAAIGLLVLGEARDPERESFDAEKLRLARALGDQAASSIRRALLHTQTKNDAIELANAYEATIEGWSHALDLRDNETEGHTQRVTAATVSLAQKFGFNVEQLLHIRRGALLHDIGKMGIPDAILLKPGTLTAQEWEIMRRHPDYAQMLLSPIRYLAAALDIPYCHHEKWDGTGYPRRLAGTDIPLTARLFAVVDVWDALISNRPYRAGLPQARVVEYIREHSGIDFDPQVVDIFLELLPSLSVKR